jgi:geranylgeranyl reductase family protein
MSATDDELFDVAVVGAGPAGATCAYYLASSGARVLLFERKRFPREKLCGDAVCTNAQIHLERMGVLAELEREQKGQWAAVGGLISPARIGFIGNSATQLGRPLVIAVKRIWLDEKIARAAARAGAHLVEDTHVSGGRRDASGWTLDAVTGGCPTTYRARALVAADGALSRLTAALGIPTPPPDAVCSRAYVKAGTHRFDADGVVVYRSDLAPGYFALFREAQGDLNFCTYIIPGGRAQTSDLWELHHRILAEDAYIRRALGPDAVIEKMRGAPLRLGGIAKSYYDRLLIVGDAAGQIDPLTGEGIHHAMDGGHLAAETLIAGLAAGDLSERFLARYHRRWQKQFGRDFFWSRQMARVFARAPFLVDVTAGLMQRRGADYMAEWGRIMTGAAPKSELLRPTTLLPLVIEAGHQLWSRYVERRAPTIEYSVEGVRTIWQPAPENALYPASRFAEPSAHAPGAA